MRTVIRVCSFNVVKLILYSRNKICYKPFSCLFIKLSDRQIGIKVFQLH